ncbi:MAG: YwaF family protein [Bacilli bacterium]|nr:YwaF family protein [Bacilli bacterium]
MHFIPSTKQPPTTPYGFFDDAYTLSSKGYAGQDRMSAKQFVVMGILFLLIVIASILLRKAKREKLYTIYRVLAIAMPLLEISKIIFSSYFDIVNGASFNWGGILPFYTCSMLLYFLPFVAWGKGKMKKWSSAFFATIGLVAGLSNFVYLSAAGWYPIFTFGCIYSILFHGAIVFVGMSLIITGEYTPSWISVRDGMIPVLMFSAFIIPINFIIRAYAPDSANVDYMLLMNCNEFPIIGDFAAFLTSHNLTILFTLFMLVVVYPAATAIIVSIEVGLLKLFALPVRRYQKRTD